MRKCRVGIFFGLSYQSHRAVAYALSRVMRGQAEFSLTHVNVDLSYEMVRARILESVYSSEPFDVYVVLGLRCSVHARRVLRELMLNKPLIFVGVKCPEAVGLIESYEVPGLNVTGVIYEMPEDTAIAQYLLPFKPYINKIFIPYCSFQNGDYMQQQVEALARYFIAQGIPVEPAGVDSYKELPGLLADRVARGNLVLLLEGMAGNVHEQASYLCWERDAFLCASGLEAIEAGALCTYGVDLFKLAEGVCQALLAFWIDKVPLGSIPVLCLPDRWTFVVNTSMARTLGLPLAFFESFRDLKKVLLIKKWANCPIERI